MSLSERWAQICNFVQTRWIQLQEVKIEFEQIHTNLDKVEKWLATKEDEVNKMQEESNLTDQETFMQQVNTLEVS